MKSKSFSRQAMQINECEACNTPGEVCELHQKPQLDKIEGLPSKNAKPSKEYENNKTYQDKGPETELQLGRMAFDLQAASSPGAKILQYVKTKKVQLEQLLEKRGEATLVGKISTDLKDTIPGAAQINTSTIAGIIVKYLIQSEATQEGHKVPVPFNDSQFLQEIEPVLERKQASMKPEIYCPNCGEEATSTKPGFVSCPECDYKGPDEIGGERVVPKMKNIKASDEELPSKVAAAGGANEEEPEEKEEEEDSLDASVVALLDSCKNEWTSLGEPVNPTTWPKEIERAILDLNDSVVKAIKTIQDKLVEGEYYIKNVDEGVDSGGGSSAMLNDLNIAPPEPEAGNELAEKPKPEMHSPNTEKMGGRKLAAPAAAKNASTEVTSTETKKAIKFVEDLQNKVADIFFEYKKTVETANNSALVKSGGEDMVRLKGKLTEIEKVLDKQFTVLESAEEAIDDKKKTSAKKELPEFIKKKQEEAKDKKEEPKKEEKKSSMSCEACGNPIQIVGECKNCESKKKKSSLFMGLNLVASE